jgi:tetratricopeptide (TPR) repeat protein
VSVDVGQLAQWQVAIYWLHDAERFDELAATAAKIFAALGSSDDAAQAVGRCIGAAYRYADQAELAFHSGRLADERSCYRQAREILQQAASLLDLPPDVAAAQVNWWYQFRHRRWIAAAGQIWMQHMRHTSPRGFALLPLMIMTLLRIGQAHNCRDRAGAIAAAERYWSLLLRAYDVRPIPYLG